ncbi:hypothetical protein BDV97DRAFT_401762 [Delphinella strobiligena]|nr:hypothetical protein BDV97DRAFT_401762 [Delphinella strobiligena]
MSNNSAVNRHGPSRWDNTSSAVITRYSLSNEKSSSDILANLESVDAIAMVGEIISARHRLGVDQSSMLAQKMSMLGPEAISHLYQDPELLQTCRRDYGRQSDQLDVTVQDQNTGQTTVDIITTPTITVSTHHIMSSTAVSGISSDTDAVSGQHTARPRSKSVGSPPSVSPPPIPRKAGVKCPRTDCRGRVFYKTQRGLREHLILTHALSAVQARHDTDLAFVAFHDTTPRTTRSRRFGVHEDSQTPVQTRLQRDSGNIMHDVLAIGDQSLTSAAIDPTLHNMPLDTGIVSTWSQRPSSPSSMQRNARQGQSLHQSELQNQIPSGLRQNQATPFQQVPDVATTSTPVFEHRPYFWSNSVVLPPTREPRFPMAVDNNSLQQAGSQQYDQQRYDTWQYGTQQYDAQQNGTQGFGVQQRGLQQHDQQQEDTDGHFDQSTFPPGYMGWNHDP